MSEVSTRRTFVLGVCTAFLSGSATAQLGKPLTKHIVLLGDSVFDNADHVAGGPDVVQQLRQVLPSGWQATLLAEDGALIVDVHRQLARLPQGTTHLVISAGGNDALAEASLLDAKARSVAE